MPPGVPPPGCVSVGSPPPSPEHCRAPPGAGAGVVQGSGAGTRTQGFGGEVLRREEAPSPLPFIPSALCLLGFWLRFCPTESLA